MVYKYAIIQNHLVANVAVADDEAFAVAHGWVPCPDHVGPGWNYIEGQFIEPVIELRAPEPVATVESTLADLLQQVNDLQSKILLLSSQKGA